MLEKVVLLNIFVETVIKLKITTFSLNSFFFTLKVTFDQLHLNVSLLNKNMIIIFSLTYQKLFISKVHFKMSESFSSINQLYVCSCKQAATCLCRILMLPPSAMQFCNPLHAQRRATAFQTKHVDPCHKSTADPYLN